MTDSEHIVADTADTARLVESASASTACQTSSSKFAYTLTGITLGVLCMLAVAVALLLYSAFAAALVDRPYIAHPRTSYYDYDYDDYYYDDDDYYDFGAYGPYSPYADLTA